MMSSGQVLYYPYTHFRDSKWLKLAALYYDEVTRMVPEQFAPEDSEDVKALSDVGFVRQIDTAPSAERVALEFTEYLDRYLSDEQQRNKLFPELARAATKLRIQPGKMAEAVRIKLENLYPDQKLPTIGDDFDLGPGIGGVYLAFLAKKISFEHTIPIVTHDPIFQRLMYQPMPTSGTAADHFDQTFLLASLVIEAAVPEDPSTVPIDSIIRFRKRYAEERFAFFEAVNDAGMNIDPTSNEETLKKYLDSKKRAIEKTVANLRKAMNSVRVATAQNFIYCSVPSWLVGNWGFGIDGAHHPSIAVGAATLSAAINIYKGHQDLNRTGESPWAYVLSLKKLQPSFLSQMQIRSDPFTLFG